MFTVFSLFLGQFLYKTNVYDKFKFSSSIALLEVIRKERNGESQNRELLRDSINVFSTTLSQGVLSSLLPKVYVELGQKQSKIDMDLYIEDFEQMFIKESREYYRLKSRNWLDQDSCPDYMRKVEQCLSNEKSRLSSYIHVTSTEKLMQTIRCEMLKQHQTELLAKRSGISNLLEKESKEGLVFIV